MISDGILAYMNQRQKLLAFVGLSGSGKTTASRYLRDKGYPTIHFGTIIRDAMEREMIEPTWDNQQQFREQIRSREGKDILSQQVAKQVRTLFASGQHHIVLDGLYTWPEYRDLQHEFPGSLTLIAIVTPRPIRYRRMEQRPERPMTRREVDERDWAEIENLEKGGPIAIADYVISNDHDIKTLYKHIDHMARRIGFIPR